VPKDPRVIPPSSDFGATSSSQDFVCFAPFAVIIPPRLENLFAILYEDTDLLVVNKPAGLVCHPTKGDAFSSLISRARIYLHSSLSANKLGKTPSLERSAEGARTADEGRNDRNKSSGSGKIFKLQPSAFSLQPCLVNRLDRETSGVVLIAKNSATAGELGKILESLAVQKEYLAIVHGHVRDDHGLVDAPLGRDEHSRVAVKDCVRPDGTPAQTEFWVEKRFIIQPLVEPTCPPSAVMLRRTGWSAGTHGDVSRQLASSSIPVAPKCNEGGSTQFSLLRVIPRTGRKHQIRLHLAHLGHPIVGDKLYGGDEDLYLALVEDRLTPEQHARLVLPNQALHARAVRFIWRGRPVEFCCAPEPWFADFIAKAQSF
jgi:23S rRNA pseudouridine1911/1915/1917 synthase